MANNDIIAYYSTISIHLKDDLEENLINVILVNAQVLPGHLEGGVVENVHQEGRLYAHFPCMVAKGLTQGMAANRCLQVQRLPSGIQDTESLGAA